MSGRFARNIARAVQIVEECYQNPFKRQFTSYGVLKVLSTPYLVPALLVATMRKW